jgi:hypothetical protein
LTIKICFCRSNSTDKGTPESDIEAHKMDSPCTSALTDSGNGDLHDCEMLSADSPNAAVSMPRMLSDVCFWMPVYDATHGCNRGLIVRQEADDSGGIYHRLVFAQFCVRTCGKCWSADNSKCLISDCQVLWVDLEVRSLVSFHSSIFAAFLLVDSYFIFSVALTRTHTKTRRRSFRCCQIFVGSRDTSNYVPRPEGRLTTCLVSWTGVQEFFKRGPRLAVQLDFRL